MSEVKKYPIYENFDKKKIVGEVILRKDFDWDKVAITETLIGDYRRKGKKIRFIARELDSFAIINRNKRINRP